MSAQTLTNLLLTGILLMQAYALIFRRNTNGKNPPKFPIE